MTLFLLLQSSRPAEKLGVIGEFVVSMEVQRVLLEFSDKLNAAQEAYAPEWLTVYQHHEEDSRECLERVRVAALRDLKISQARFP